MAMRLDKYLANMGIGSRSEVKRFISYGKIKVNGEVVKKIDYKVDIEKDLVEAYGSEVGYSEFVYLIMNKPMGVITATEDAHAKTVLDLIQHKRKKDLFPVGRLDKDTEGLLILTNDGQLAHRVLSPKKHVDKVYYAEIEGVVRPEHVKAFAEGLVLEDGYKTLPAVLEIIESAEESRIRVTIREGKYHQVKRMFESIECRVVFLKRVQMGGLALDPELRTGSYREMTLAELALVES